ncbi:unnamed protein product [Rhizoctonia solani]|uniref:Uncharacterized protein n=1 Tax=Rhizoctonia solani TaxID=456999 RepID=A0A8H3B4E1_9AGAM|nr:unnamed protein product [Rhizoctonia solani]
MDDELWGNAWGSTTDTKGTTTKVSDSPKLAPTWPTKPIPTPGLSDGWGTSSAWGASSTSVNLNDAGGGWGDSLEYENQASEPVASHTEPVVPIELGEESEEEYEQVVHLSAVDHQTDIPHSPLPTSPPPESLRTTTDSRSSSPSHRFSTEDPTQDLPVTPRVAQAAVPPSPPQPDLDNSFGGFETGNEARLRVTTGEEEDPWSPAAGDLTFPAVVHDSPRVETDSVVGGDAWGSNWQPKDERQDDQPLDEWEQARIKKERRDRKVSPEVLSGYLTGWESVVSEIYPDAPLPRSEPTTEWRSSMEEISELQTLRKLYRLPILATTLSSPPPMLSPLPPCSSLQIHSRQRAALKATRISAVSQLSPFAHLTSARSIQTAHRFSSKPSVSISKSSLDFGDDVVGVGWAWAHNEKTSEPKPIPAPVTIAPAPIVAASTPSPTPATPTPTGRFSGFWARARGSTDKSSVGQGSRSNTPVPLTSPSTSSLGEATNSTKLPEPPAAESSSVLAQPQPVEPPVPALAPAPATSGVSRFFKRFSRSNPVESERSRLATSESVSLSAEDLEFLADSVPDTTDKSLLDGGRGITEFDALEAMLRSKPLPKDVPALAPPPRVMAPSSGSPSPLAMVPESHNAGEDDLWDIFSGPSNGHSSRSSLPAPPRVAPAAVSLTPKLTTPVSSAPGSRSHTPRLPSMADLSTIVGGKGSHLRQTSFSGRPQQAFRTDVPSLDSPPIPALPPPPGSTATTSLMETDPFDAFVSAPAGPPGQTQSRISFDDFGDFESSGPVSIQASSISSPPPLTINFPPVTTSSVTSPPPITFSSPPPPKPPPKTGTPAFIRMGANIQRVHTPPSLPPLLPPPGHSNISTPSHSFTIASAPVIAPSLNPTPQPQINLFDFGSSPPKNVPVPVPSFAQTPKPTTTSRKGGLSASDLSFFEGL